MEERGATEYEEPCGCGLWICRECRPENFDPEHPLNNVGMKAKLRALEAAARKPASPHPKENPMTSQPQLPEQAEGGEGRADGRRWTLFQNPSSILPKFWFVARTGETPPPAATCVEVIEAQAADTHIARLQEALEEAVRALVEVAETDWTEPPADMPDEIARRALERFGYRDGINKSLDEIFGWFCDPAPPAHQALKETS